MAAQKALSAIYRTGQRFGAHHLVDVLAGADSERIKRLGHDRLKTFGIGGELDRRGWLSVFRQLVAQGFAVPDVAHGGLSLGPGADEILRGQRTVRFRHDGRDRETRRRQPEGCVEEPALDAAAESLFEALRGWRLDEARRQELPPYVIFHDATLREIARRRPATRTELAEIPGIGKSKLDRYGTALLAIAVPMDISR